MGIRDVSVRDGYAGLLHLRQVTQGVGRESAVEAWEAGLAERIGDRSAGHVVDRCGSVVDRGIDVLAAEESLVAEVGSGLVRQPVGPGVGDVRGISRADAPARAAVDGDADVVRQRLRPRGSAGRGGVRGHSLAPFRRAGAERLGHVAEGTRAGVLELDVRQRDGAEVTACPRERNPRRGRRLLPVGDHVRQCVIEPGGVVDQVRPVLEGGAESGNLARRLVEVAVRHRHALPVGVQARHCRKDPAGGVRDQDRVVVGEERSVRGEEVEQMRHLLEV